MTAPKPCLHQRARHQHGSHLAYAKDGCRCQPCTLAQKRHSKIERYKSLTGTHSYVAADRARVHVEGLLRTLTVGQVEARSGVNRTSIRLLVGDYPGRPRSKRIARASERALMAVTAERVGIEQHGLVDGTGTRRRLRALIALGWPARTLGRRGGLSSRTTWDLTRPDALEGSPVMVSTRDTVLRLYDELSLTLPPPSAGVTRARALAASRRWPPPLAYDDDTIDDPAARPMHDLRGTPGRQRDEDRDERVLELTRAGLSAAEIALRLRITERSVQRVRAKYRAEDVA